MTIDWTPVVVAGVGGVAALIPPSVAVLVAWLKSRNQALLAQAAQAAGGVAYDSLVSASKGGTAVDWNAARATAIQEGLAAFKTITQQPVTPAHEAMVTGALGDNLASDPATAVGGASTATAIAQPGETAVAAAG